MCGNGLSISKTSLPSSVTSRGGNKRQRNAHQAWRFAKNGFVTALF
jgi:hypothetical protein